MAPKQPTPPKAEKRPVTLTRHGVDRTDPYAWLKDEKWREVMRDPSVMDADIRAYLEAENAYAGAILKPVGPLCKTLFAEMKGRIKEDDATVPAPDGSFAYYVQYEEGGQHPVFCRRSIGGPDDGQVLVDGNKEAAGEAYYRLGSCVHSPDHKLLAYSVDLSGAEYFTVRVRDLDSGTDLDDRIVNAQSQVVWANDGRTLFYTVLDDNHRPCKVFRHRVGEETDKDVLVYEERDPGFFIGLGKTESRRFIEIVPHDNTTTEVYLIDADRPDGEPALVGPRQRGVEYSLSDHGERFLILTNADGAEDFKIAEAPLDAPGREHWRDLVPHEPGRLIRAMRVFRDHVVRFERVDALPRFTITRLSDGSEHVIAFDEDAYDLGVEPMYEFDTTVLRFSYSSMTTPEEVYDYDMVARSRVLLKRQEVPSGHEPADYVTRRLVATSHDGARVPVSVLHHKDTPLDGTAPLLLYGYGSYGASMPASFSTNRLSLVDRGFVYAVAHIRGGMEKGYAWYTGGKLFEKKNTFLDFIAAAEALIAQDFTAKGGIIAHGGSAGGMLMGAVSNMRPDLFGGIIAEVPFVDVLNTICDDTLPLTPPEWPEWGNPIKDREAYDYIASYSPYDNITDQSYPDILATGGISDPRVTYWEPAKWVARLREHNTGESMILMRLNMQAGHGGAAGRFDRLEEVAVNYAFALMVAGKA